MTPPPPVAHQVDSYTPPPVQKKGPNRTLVLALTVGGIGLVAIAAILLVVFLVILAPKNRPGQLSSASTTLPEATSTQPPTSEPAATPTLLPTETPVQAATAPVAVNIPPDCSKPEVFCVGLVTDGGHINDNGFNQDAWNGVQLAVNKLGAFGQFTETSNPADFLKNIAQFGDSRFDVIITVGFTMTDATTQAAQKYPDVRFIAIDQYQAQPSPNVIGLTFPEDQSGFLAGALAAQMSKTGKIGAVLGPDYVPAVWRFGEGYKAGASYARPGIQVNLVYQNNASSDKVFNDPDWGKATALELVNTAHDVIFGAGGVTGNAAILAAAEKGVMVIGVDLDQYFTLPTVRPVLLTSAIKLVGSGVFDLINLAQQENFPSGNFQGLGGIAPYHDMDSKIPADVKVHMQKLIQDIANGIVKTGVSPAKP